MSGNDERQSRVARLEVLLYATLNDVLLAFHNGEIPEGAVVLVDRLPPTGEGIRQFHNLERGLKVQRIYLMKDISGLRRALYARYGGFL